jgi:hypothetical protein
VNRNTTPIIAAKAIVSDALAAENRGLRNRRISSIGVAVRSSQATNAAPIRRPAPNAPRTIGSPQPLEGASMMAQVRLTRPPIERSTPGMSIGQGSGSRDSGMRLRPAMTATAISGMFTQNTALQLKDSSSSPPAIGPRTIPSPETAAQAAIAFPRSLAGKMLVMIERVAGMMNAPPIPISALLAISISGLPERAEAIEPAPKTSSPN